MRFVKNNPLLVVFMVVASIMVFQHGDNPLGRFIVRTIAFPVGMNRPSDSNMAPAPQQTDSKSQTLFDDLRINAMAAKVVKREINPYRRRLIINKGTKDGVAKGQLIVSEGYLVGVVLDVKQETGVLHLVSDPTFRMAVTIDGVQGQSVLKGSNNNIVVDRIPPISDLGGRTVYSYGDGEAIANIPIGRLTTQLQPEEQLVLKRFQLDRPVREEYIGSLYVVMGLK